MFFALITQIWLLTATERNGGTKAITGSLGNLSLPMKKSNSYTAPPKSETMSENTMSWCFLSSR